MGEDQTRTDAFNPDFNLALVPHGLKRFSSNFFSTAGLHYPTPTTMLSQLAVACCAAGPPTAASATPHQPPHRVAHTAIVDADAPAFDALTERLHALETEANRPG